MSMRAPAFALLLLPMLGCGDRTPPVLHSVEVMAPSAHTPLAALLTASTDEPARFTLEITDGQESVTVMPDPGYHTTHRVPVLGLRPGRPHRITATVEDQTGNRTTSEPVTITTDPLPDDFPPLRVETSEPTRMEPGVTIFATYRWPDGGTIDQSSGLILVMDARGQVVWYYVAEHSIGDVIQLRSGNFLYTTGVDGVRARLVEIDVFGEIVQSWHSRSLADAGLDNSILVDVDSFHHEIAELPSGDFLTFTSEVRTFDDYPSSADDPDAPRVTQEIVGDVIIEVARDGTVVRDTHLLDIVDPYRIGPDSLGQGFWRTTYRALGDDEPELADWAHANALVYDPATDSYIAALRHQDAIVKIDRATSQIAWILGPHTGWRPPWNQYLLHPGDGLDWAYHSHGLDLTPDGTLLMFDNGNTRASAFEARLPAAEAYSRVAEFRVDEAAMEVELVWSYRGPDGAPFYSGFLSDADWLPVTGNLLVDDGARNRPVDDGSGDTTDHNLARIFELTHTTPAEMVFEVIIDDAPPAGWRVYRAQRIPGLYP